MKRAWLVVALGGLVAGGWWGSGVLFPGEAVRLRRSLEELAGTLSFDGREGNLAMIRDVSAVVDRFAPDASIQVEILGAGQFHLSGRDEIQQALFGARRAARRMDVKFFDIEVEIADDDQTARAHLAATADVQGRRRNQEGFEAIEFLFRLRRLEGRWKIQQVETVPTLKQ